MKTTELLHCVHSMYWKTCNLCKDKDEKIVRAELKKIEEERHSRLLYDYQDAVEQSNLNDDEDRDYDFDDGLS